MAGGATPTSSAGHPSAGANTTSKLTFKSDHQSGAGQVYVTQFKSAMIFLAAFTGLIGAACVNGFPSITCNALADAYTIALANLGAIFLIEFLTFVVIVAVEILFSRDADIHTISTLGPRLGIAGAFLLVVFSFYAIMQTTIHGVKNIQ